MFTALGAMERARQFAREAAEVPRGRKRKRLNGLAQYYFELSAVLYLVELLGD